MSGEKAEPTKGAAQPRRPPLGVGEPEGFPPRPEEAAEERAEGDAQGRGPTVGSVPVGGVGGGKGPGTGSSISLDSSGRVPRVLGEAVVPMDSL